MRALETCLKLAAGIAVLLITTGDARAETFNLEMKRLPSSFLASGSSEDAAFQSRVYQSIYAGNGPFGRTNDRSPFSKVVTKEPKYEFANPLKGVAKLGTREFGFAFDVVPAKSDKPKATTRTIRSSMVRYTHLYFDCNGNGDLTDDQVVEAEAQPSPYTFFPRVDVTLDIDGTQMGYAFYMRTYPASSSYGYAFLCGAAYRHGEITLNGEKRRVVVVDSNSNARFDDTVSLGYSSDGTIYPSASDTIFIDPAPSKGGTPTNDVQQPVGKLVNVKGRFYSMELSPAGDKLTLTPSSVPVGYVSNPNKGVHALVHGDAGTLRVSLGESGKSPLPVGDWKLLSYTIDRTAIPETKGEESSLLNTLSAALVQSSSSPSSRRSYVSARAKKGGTAVNVREGETVDLPFGSPYKPIVKVSRTSGSSGNRTAHLSLSLVGAGGEIVNDIMVNGSRPSVPEFTITSAEEKVAQGKFRYG